MKRFVLSIYLFTFWCLTIYGAPLTESATISYQVVDLKSGKMIAEQNPKQCATPGSITKLITTATALESLGAHFTFETNIEHDGILKEGTLHGNLYIKGAGDPTLGSFYLGDPSVLNKWANQLYAKGIRIIEGDIIADASCFDNEPIPVQWSWEDIGNYYAAGAYGLSFYDNTLQLTFQSGASNSQPRLISVFPNIPELVIKNELLSRPINVDSGYIYGMPYDNYRIIRGAIPSNRKQFMVKGDIPNPPLLVAQLLDSALQQRGIHVSGRSKVAHTPSEAHTILLTYNSPELYRIIKLTNFKSNNLYAEHLFKRLGEYPGKAASNAQAIEYIKEFWSKKGIDVASLYLYDGSGLSPQDAFSAETMNNILCYMYHNSAHKEFFIESIPLVGKEGTVSNFLVNTPLEGVLRLKSGSMGHVQCYSGYYLDANKQYAITVMVNNWRGSRNDVRAEIKKWLLKLTD